MRYFILFTGCCLFIATFANANPGRLVKPEIIVYDDRFYDFVDADSQVEILASDLGWAEGPVWVAALNSLLFSDLAADKVYRWDESAGLRVYLFPSGHVPDNAPQAWRGSNGLAIDQHGDLLLAQQSNRRVSRMLGSLDDPIPDYEVLADNYQGKLLNSPNDLVVHRSGDIFFTDPPYGLAGFEKSPDIELDFFGVFRLSRQGELIPLATEIVKPNGIALSIDQARLYVSNSETDHPQIIAIDLDNQLGPTSSRLFFDARKLLPDGPGSTDGLTVHASDFVFVSIPNGLGILSPQGELLGKIALGQVTNMAFDDTFSHLYITAPNRLLRLNINRSN
jgi:gluconolactonase